MKAMLYSDFLNIKQSFKTLFILLIIFAANAALSRSTAMLGMIVIMISIMLPFNILHSESMGWEKLALSFPVSRTHMICSKYVTCFSVTTALIMASVVWTVIQSMFYHAQSDELLMELITLPLFAAIALLFNALIIPMAIKFGVMRARYMLVAVSLVPTALVLFVSRLAIENPFTKVDLGIDSAAVIIGCILLVSFLLYIISIQVSIHIYKKKEF